MTPDRNLNALWLRCILQEVLISGVQDAIVCPGGRAIALCLAIRHHPAFRHTIACTDERSAAFIALGLARSAGRPVVIVTTSGSAVANLVPALTEAQALHVPLILLTCDRPRHLRYAGYSQMTDHIGACQAFVSASIDLPDPVAEEEAILALRTQISTVIAAVVNPEIRGIVQINIPMEGMHDSTEVPDHWQPPSLSLLASAGRKDAAGQSAPMTPFGFSLPPYATVASIGERLHLGPGLRGLIVAGPECPLSSDEVDALSIAVGFPVLADVASGLRRPAITNLVSPLDVLSAHPGVRTCRPQLVIRLGLEPTLVLVHQYLLEHPCPAIKITTRVIARDYLHPGCECLVRPTRTDLAALAALLAPGNPEWLAHWQQINGAMAPHRQRIIADLEWGELKAAQIICNAEHFEFFHFANSMSIRNADMCADPTTWSQRAFSNRGVNGIDGTLGSFIGELIGSGQSGLLLLGDLAFVHDLSALAYPDGKQLDGCICVMNNGGGAIFDLLPASGLPGYESTIRNTARINIAAAADCFGLPYQRAQNVVELRSALQQAAGMRRLNVLEVCVPPHSLQNDNIVLRDALRRVQIQRPKLTRAQDDPDRLYAKDA